MSRVFFIVVCFIVCLKPVSAQTLFNIIPDVGGVKMQGWGQAIISDSLSIFVLGYRKDTTTSQLPWLGEFNYSGELIRVSPIIDSLYNIHFNIDEINVAHKSGDVYYIFSRRALGGNHFTPYIFELNVRTGEVTKSALIPNSIYPQNTNGQAAILFNQNNNTITLLTFVYFPDSYRKTFVTELDTFFQIKKLIEIDNYADHHTPMSIKINDDTTYSIVGFSYSSDSTGNFVNNTYFIRTDTMGNLLDAKHSLAPIPVGQYILGGSNKVEVDEFGNWVIAGQQLNPNCVSCFSFIPYIFSVTPDFSKVLWQTRFTDPPPDASSYIVYGMTKTYDGYVGAGDYSVYKYSISAFESGGLLFKASTSGDSLWMRYYIPLGWERSEVAWAQLHDIKTTPFGTIVATGVITDSELDLKRPWVLHLDSDGCLVPGCNTVGLEESQPGINPDKFKIFPNPASKELYLLSKITSNDPIKIQLVNNSGKLIKARELKPSLGYQYSLPVEDLVPGVYFLILTDLLTLRSESHSFIRQ